MEDVIDKYIDSVLAEAGLYSECFKEHRVDTLFIGGGTPSVLSKNQIRTLINGLKEAFDFELKEATIEANPESIDEEKLAVYADCGLDRISIGLQTHDDEILKRIGRGHTFDAFSKAYESARRRFKNINIDTIFGLPGQTKEIFRDTVNLITGLAPSHVSAYSLKLEDGTQLARVYSGADEDDDRDMYHHGAEMLGKASYIHYETSNFAKENAQCLHNLKYWLGQEYLGLGLAAHSFQTGIKNVRFSNAENMKVYIQAVTEGRKPVAHTFELSQKDEMTEYIMLRLRLSEGISYGGFSGRFNIDFKDVFGYATDFAEKSGLIIKDEYGIYPTIKGFDLQNTLITEFMKII
jgi:oxygen-independent coproporphyrinogen-3 oxidase